MSPFRAKWRINDALLVGYNRLAPRLGLLQREYDLAELSAFSAGATIYISAGGSVWDVSAEQELFGPAGT